MEPVSHSSEVNSAFRLLIREEFLRRCKVNSNYSLRAFARQLGVDPSLLSKVMRGQRKPSRDLITVVGTAIGIRPSKIAKLLKGKGDINYSNVDGDVFTVISDWCHFSILELMKTRFFQSDFGWMAQRLSLRKAEVEAAVERLIRLQFVEITDGLIRLKAQNNTWANNSTTTIARRSLQKQLTLKAADAIDRVPFELRESGSLTIACPATLVPELKRKI